MDKQKTMIDSEAYSLTEKDKKELLAKLKAEKNPTKAVRKFIKALEDHPKAQVKTSIIAG